jgi:hypothetical protein
MKKWIIVLLLLLLFAPFTCLADGEEAKKAGPGIASGQVFDEAGSPLPGGVVSFFNAEKGVAPLLADVHRIPDTVGRMGPEGRFSLKLKPGSYYMGALIITDPGRGPGPPRAGEKFYYARDDKGDLREIAIGTGEEKDFGQVVVAPPDTFPAAKNLVTVQGRLLMDKEGIPFPGGVVLVKTNMNKQRPDFVSARTDEAGRYEIKLPADTPYFLLGRERAVGRPVPGTYIGTYGSETAINLGGMLPIGTMRPAQPAPGMPPQVEGMNIGPSKDLPKTVMGKPGQTLTGVDIKMFRTPVPEEIREKLQGTLGFGSKMQGTSEEQPQTTPKPEKDK